MRDSHGRASKKQQELLRFVDTFIKGNGYGPSYREIMGSLGYKSVSTVAIHIDNLIAKGYLRRKDKSARSLEVVTLQSDAHMPNAVLDWRDELRRHLETKQLDSSQWSSVTEVFTLLGIEDTLPSSAPKGGA